MKQLDFDRAFPQTPDCIHAAIELGFRKGQKKMKLQHKIIGMASIAAAIAIMIAVAAFATGGLGTPPKPDVLAQPPVTDVPKVQEEPMVWCTEKGNYYHYDEHCSGMEGAKRRPLTEAQEMGKNTCPVCGPSEYDGQAGKEPIEFIYYSEDSQYFHKNQTCAGETYPLKAEALNTFFAAADAAVNKSPCPVCLPHGITMIGDGAYVNLHKTPEITPAEPDPKAELFAEATVFCTEGGSYYHSYADCSGMLNASAIRLSEAVEMGKETCPRCLGPAFVFTTPHGEYYHSEKNCSGMEGATAMNPEEALWWDKHPCPTCIIDKKVNVASCDMYYHESDACSAAEFYYDKYPLLDALTIGMTPCPECTAVEVTPEEENQDAFWAEAEADQEERVYAAYGKPLYYHKADVCNGQQNNRSLTLANAEKEQLIPCPVCFPNDIEEYVPMNSEKTSSRKEESKTNSTIVYTAYGKSHSFYHKIKNCGGKDYRRELTEDQAIHENLQACLGCFFSFVYYTEHGRYYHSDAECSGMMNASAHPREDARRDGKLPCPICLMVYANEDGLYFHLLSGCMGQDDEFHTLEEAHAMGNQRCPICLSPATVYATKLGAYFHAVQDCSGMKGASATTPEAEWNNGKLPCPVCITSNVESLSELQSNPAESAASTNESATSMADIDANLSFLGTITQIDRLYQAAFGNLEDVLAAGYGFMPEIAENYWMLTNGQQTVLSLNYQEVGSDPSLEAKRILNVMLNNGREISNRFMESIRNYPMSSFYPMAIDAARDHMREIQPGNAEAFDPYVEAILLEFDETFQMQNCKIQFPCAMHALYVEFQAEEREDGGRSWDVKTYTKTA